MAIERGHGIVLVGDALPGFGVGEGVRDEGDDSVIFGVGSFGGIEAESGFAAGLTLGIYAVIWSVAHDALG